MGAFSNPILIGTERESVLLDRIPLGGGANGAFSERTLQEALFRFPESLPVREIDPNIGPLIPVCMEIETGSGPADVLCVTPTGQVVLIETKLWRNPEARREVVGQVLDYAKQLTSWTYEILDQKAAIATGSGNNYLLSCLKKRYPDADEATFVDGVGRSLSSGDFLLLIVGDGIRYGAEALVSFLERYGHLRFGLGLIEVAAFRLPDGTTLLQPRVLAKTEILVRTVLMGPNGPVTLQQAALVDDAAAPIASQRAWFVEFWTDFLSKLSLENEAWKDAEPSKSTNQFFAMPPDGGKAWVSAYIAQSSSKGGVYLTFAKAYERGPEIYEILESDREAIEREVGAKLTWERTGDKVYLGVPNISFSDLNVPAERDRVTSYLAEMVQRMVRVLTPRLEAATRLAN